MPWPIWSGRWLRSALPRLKGYTIFTQADQVNQLVSASEADPDLGFMARMLVMGSLPRTNPGDRAPVQARQRAVQAHHDCAGGDNKLPYGNLPRLLMAWRSTEAVKTQSRELVLGRSLSKFMRALGINSTSGGARGEQTRLRDSNAPAVRLHGSIDLRRR